MMRRTIRTTIGSLVFVTVALFAQLVTAQEAATRVVILDVAGGGTEELEAAFAELPRVELRDQKWFVAEVKKSDVRASRLMTRPDDLKFVMSSSGTSYVVAVQPDDDFWSVLFFDETGEAVREFEIERQADELSARKAASIRDIFVELLPASAPATDETAADEPDPEVVEDAERIDEVEALGRERELVEVGLDHLHGVELRGVAPRDLDGRAEVARYYARVRDAFPDQRSTLVELHHADDAVIVELELRGTHLGSLRGEEPTGQAYRVRTTAFFVFDDARLVGKRVYGGQVDHPAALGA